MESEQASVTYPIPPEHIKFTRRLIYPEAHKHCFYCGKELKGRQRHYCSEDHGSKYHRLYDWVWARKEIYKKYDGLCQKCGTSTFFNKHETSNIDLWAEIDHIEAIALGGDMLDRENLTLYCHKCHKEKTKNVDYAKMYPKQKDPHAIKLIKPLLEFFT